MSLLWVSSEQFVLEVSNITAINYVHVGKIEQFHGTILTILSDNLKSLQTYCTDTADKVTLRLASNKRSLTNLVQSTVDVQIMFEWLHSNVQSGKPNRGITLSHWNQKERTLNTRRPETRTGCSILNLNWFLKGILGVRDSVSIIIQESWFLKKTSNRRKITIN